MGVVFETAAAIAHRMLSNSSVCAPHQSEVHVISVAKIK